MEQWIKKVDTQGILDLKPLGDEWYWGMDYTSGDLYEAEELFRQGHLVSQNRLIFVHYPDGRVVQPPTNPGQYWGRPICDQGKVTGLRVDFPAEQIEVLQFSDTLEQSTQLALLPLSSVEDCYNLHLKQSPLMLTRQGQHDQFQILWPETVSFPMGNREVFLFRSGDTLYFSAWDEDPDYREEIILRDLTGQILDRFPGSLMRLPNGQAWVLA